MEKLTLDKDINVFCIKANSFPDGIDEAYDKLQSIAPMIKERRIFGLSRPNRDGIIVYYAAAEEAHDGEGKKLGCETLTIKNGEYISMMVNDFTKDPQNITKAFGKLLAHPGIDPDGYCVEWLMDNGKDMRCMVRLKQ